MEVRLTASPQLPPSTGIGAIPCRGSDFLLPLLLSAVSWRPYSPDVLRRGCSPTRMARVAASIIFTISAVRPAASCRAGATASTAGIGRLGFVTAVSIVSTIAGSGPIRTSHRPIRAATNGTAARGRAAASGISWSTVAGQSQMTQGTSVGIFATRDFGASMRVAGPRYRRRIPMLPTPITSTRCSMMCRPGMDAASIDDVMGTNFLDERAEVETACE